MRQNAVRFLAGASLLTLAACGTASSSTSTPAAGGTTPSPSSSVSSSASASTAKPTSGAMVKGAYLSLADYQKSMEMHSGTKVVYFFHANWCPDCRATEESLTKDGVPDGLTVVKVDYDTATDLKAKYGITQQHTFVLLDKDGMSAKKFTGAKSGAAILAMAS